MALDILTAELEELTRLPGVGRVIAQRIVEARDEDLIETVDDLLVVRHIGVGRLEEIRGALLNPDRADQWGDHDRPPATEAVLRPGARSRVFWSLIAALLVVAAGVGATGWWLWIDDRQLPDVHVPVGGLYLLASESGQVASLHASVVNPADTNPGIRLTFQFERQDDRAPFDWVVVGIGDLAFEPICDVGTYVPFEQLTDSPVSCSLEFSRAYFRTPDGPLTAEAAGYEFDVGDGLGFGQFRTVIASGTVVEGIAFEVRSNAEPLETPIWAPIRIDGWLQAPVGNDGAGRRIGAIAPIGGLPTLEAYDEESGGSLFLADPAGPFSLGSMAGWYSAEVNELTIGVGPLRVWERLDAASPGGTENGGEILWDGDGPVYGPAWWRTQDARKVDSVASRAFVAGILIATAAAIVIAIVQLALGNVGRRDL